jgi:uncharacterized protein DUF1302/AMIN domain-containing protein
MAVPLVLHCGIVLGQTVDNIRIGMTPDRTRVVLDLSEPVAGYHATRLAQPTRLRVDLQGFDLEFDLDTLALAGTPITSVHHLDTGNGGLQLVIELDKAVEPTVFALSPHLQHGYRLVIDLNEVQAEPVAGAAEPALGASSALRPVSSAPAAGGVATGSKNTPHREARSTSGFSFDGTWEQEWAVATDDGDSQKFEALIEPRVDYAVNSNLSVTGIARIRLDMVGDLGPGVYRPDNYSDFNGPSYNTEYAELSLRELYLDAQWAASFWRVGKQQVVWGQADGIKVLDIVNPQSFREFILDDFDDSRIPLWAVNVEQTLGDATSLQLLWIPDTTYHEFAEAGTPYFLTSPKLVPRWGPGPVSVKDVDKPDNFLDDSDAGLRLTTFAGGWDLSLNYLYHYNDTPAFYQALEAEGYRLVIPTYERSHLLGSTFSNAIGDVTLRGEVAYESDTYNQAQFTGGNRGVTNSAELSSVVGLDWQLSSATLLSGQWFYSSLFDHEPAIVRSKNEQIATLLYQTEFNNAAWQLRVLTMYSIDDQDSLVQIKLKYWYSSDLELWLGSDIASGDSAGVFGQFDDRDRVLLGAKYGF